MIDEEFMKEIRRFNEKQKHPQTYAEKLVKRIMHGKNTNQEWLALEQKVRAFLKSDASESDKAYVCGYTECMGMMCSAIREGLM